MVVGLLVQDFPGLCLVYNAIEAVQKSRPSVMHLRIGGMSPKTTDRMDAFSVRDLGA